MVPRPLALARAMRSRTCADVIQPCRWRPVELNDKHVRSHGKIGDCEQSTRVISRITQYHLASLFWFRVTGTFNVVHKSENR